MWFELHIEENDIETVRNIVNLQINHEIVIERINRNVNGNLPETSQSEIWRAQMMCLLTSQQRSGYNQPVARILDESPFRLSYENCLGENNVESFINLTLMNSSGIRFRNKIAKCAAANFNKLENGGWDELLTWRENLREQIRQQPNTLHYELERQAALYMTNYKGFGPKQSRNFWQSLGLTRYEFVLDSRITGWLQREIHFCIPLASQALGNEKYYVFISDALRELCLQAGVLPCVLDAAVFSSYG